MLLYSNCGWLTRLSICFQNDSRKLIPFFAALLMGLQTAQAASFIVNSNAALGDGNPGDGVCDTLSVGIGPCTLQAAIDEANARIGADSITFAPAGGPYTYTLATMPDITITDASLTIDASNIWNNFSDRPGLTLTCNIQGGQNRPAITLNHGSDFFAVKGVLFSGYCRGILINGGHGHVIGQAGTRGRNVFFNTVEPSIEIRNTSGSSQAAIATISHNYFGTITGDEYLSATEYFGETGILANLGFANDKEIIIENNVIVEQQYGILARNTQNISIRNNTIGYLNGRPLPNRIGIWLQGSGATVTNNSIATNSEIQLGVDTGSNVPLIDGNFISGDLYGFDNVTSTGVLYEPFYAVAVISNNTIEENYDGLVLSGSLTVVGNVVRSNSNHGVKLVQWNQNTEILNNEIVHNGGNGIHIESLTGGVTVKSNKIGITGAGAVGANQGHGIYDSSGLNTIGSTNTGEANYIGWNHGSGVYLDGARDTQIAGNIIGATHPVDGAIFPAPNGHHGIAVYNLSESNIIGRIGASYFPNYVLSSSWSGIAVVNSNHNVVQYNFIGTDDQGRDWGNGYYGIVLSGNNNYISNNTIAYNGYGTSPVRPAILVDGVNAFGNRLLRNSIHNNGGDSISLINGGNQDIDPPSLQLKGVKFSGTTYPNSEIDFYSADKEGDSQYYEGSAVSDATGEFSWQKSGKFKREFVSATTTVLPSRSTSELSFPVQVQAKFPHLLFFHLYDEYLIDNQVIKMQERFSR